MSYDAITDTTVCPDLVNPRIYGEHNSQVSSVDLLWRFWQFESESGRDKFVADAAKGMFRRKGKAP